MKLSEFRGKTVLIMGLGLHGGGAGSAEFFSRLGSRVVVTDLKRRAELRPSISKLRRFKKIVYHLGGHKLVDFTKADYVIQGPGVPENSRLLEIARQSGAQVLSDVEIFFLTCPALIVGITGTKGKSTTTWLIGRFLERGLEKRIWVGGNIRKSMLSFLPRVKKGDIVVLELSSFQLDSLRRQRLSPRIAVITNIFPDHLNRYPSMVAYTASKAGIFRSQGNDGSLFIPAGDALLSRAARGAKGRVIRVQTRRELLRLRDVIAPSIPDFHFPNIALAVAVARHLGVGKRAIAEALKDFGGVPHRMELVKKMGGVEFINDTTATNPEASRRAIISTRGRIGRRHLVVIAGGFDKGLPVGDFARVIAAHADTVVFLPGTATGKMRSKVMEQKARVKMSYASTMKEAVRLAYSAAKPVGTVLLSPGAASFGLFKHEFDRGEQFVRAVRGLH